MRQLTSFFNYSTDLVLATFLLLMIMFGFIVVSSMTPLTLSGNSEVQAVLGAQTTESPVQFQTAGVQSMTVLDLVQSGEVTELQAKVDVSNGSGFSEDLFVLEQPDTAKGLYRVELEIPEQYKYGMSYGFTVASTDYTIYDDSGDALHRDFELEVNPGETVPLRLNVVPREAINYPVEFLVRIEYSGLTELP